MISMINMIKFAFCRDISMWSYQKLCVTFVLFCFAFKNADGQFRLANVFSDDMVLQMAPKNTQIWGYGTPGIYVIVTASWTMVSTPVQDDGTWSVTMLPQPAGGPHSISISTQLGESISLKVWFGDVWFCSGQSNMKMPMQNIFNATEEIVKAATYSNLRLLHVANDYADQELQEVTEFHTLWKPPSIENVANFSALCLLYGEKMSDVFGGDRMIGLIDSSYGGTRIEAWSSTNVTDTCNTPAYNSSSSENPNAMHALWNAMVKPLTSICVRGVIWYQGEGNVDQNPEYYSCHLSALIQDWKNNFFSADQGEIAFPFGVAQIGPYSRGKDEEYGKLRWHQTLDQGVLPNSDLPETFMVATYDLTDPESPTGDIHFRDKQTVAERLANSARVLLYGENLRAYGPVVEFLVVTSPGEVTLSYDTDIVVTGTSGFMCQVSNGSWVDATITEFTSRGVKVSFDRTATHLAYAWQAVVCDYKKCPIYSADQAQLPANVWQWNV